MLSSLAVVGFFQFNRSHEAILQAILFIIVELGWRKRKEWRREERRGRREEGKGPSVPNKPMMTIATKT